MYVYVHIHVCISSSSSNDDDEFCRRRLLLQRDFSLIGFLSKRAFFAVFLPPGECTTMRYIHPRAWADSRSFGLLAVLSISLGARPVLSGFQRHVKDATNFRAALFSLTRSFIPCLLSSASAYIYRQRRDGHESFATRDLTFPVL